MSAKSQEKLNRLAIIAKVGPVAETLGLALLDAVFVYENGKRVLRLIIDKKGGVGTDDCERMSVAADPLISAMEGMTDYDVFEVSSPGLERPLKTLEDCLRHEGEFVHISLYRAVGGVKRFSGTLVVDRGDEKAGVVTEEGERILFSLQDTASIKRDVAF